LTVYNSIKMNHSNPYAIFTINPAKNEIDIFKLAEPGKLSWYAAHMMISLMTCGHLNLRDVSQVNDSLPVRKRMLYASSKDGLRRSLEGIKFCVHASEMDDLSEKAMTQAALAACKSTR
uniref:ADF-H domain-containing protein n=1 Tax=Echinostoma caproni TaxID=27848 RepID=A0A183B912_9TREM